MQHIRWMVSLVVLATLLLGACQPVVAPASGAGPETSAAEEANQAVVRRLTEEFLNEGDYEVAAAILADDAIIHSVSDEPIGVWGVTERAKSTLLHDLKYDAEIVDLFGMEDRVAMRYRASGLPTGAVLGLPCPGEDVEMEVVVIARLEDDKIAEAWLSWNMPAEEGQSAGAAVDLAGLEKAAEATVTRGLARINDITMYYEIHGEGEPLLLLGNGFESGAEGLELQLPVFAEQYQVIVPDYRAHGRTTDSDQPLSIPLMADDMIKLLDHLGIDSAHVVGWAEGGSIGLDMAINHPERVRKLVNAGGNAQVEGLTKEFLTFSAEGCTLDEIPDWVKARYYLDIAPDPDNLPVMLDKLCAMWLSSPNDSDEELAAIGAPTLVIAFDVPTFADTDHLQVVAQTIPDAQYYLMVDASGFAPREKPEEFNRVVLDFLAETGE